MDDFGGDAPKRNLTDADIDALATRLEDVMVRRFYLNLGRGLWSLVWKAVVFGLVTLAAYGAYKAN